MYSYLNKSHVVDNQIDIKFSPAKTSWQILFVILLINVKYDSSSKQGVIKYSPEVKVDQLQAQMTFLFLLLQTKI